ncbi:unnamed protein product [Parnassius apollo]|uniref:(apollo) hypothetical protein n=1 Tax=Parnassius apollo TaxID=110799 RepID=A0A8S3YA81_PARAO|nr:unnamed protein product [Parnassius apollo]
MNRKRCNSPSGVSSSRKILRIGGDATNNEEIIASRLCESDESLADENDYIQSDRDDYSEEEYCDDGEAAGAGLRTLTLLKMVCLCHIFSRHIDSENRQTGVQLSDSQVNTVAEGNVSQSRRKYYYGKKRCMKWSAEGPSRTTRTPAHNIVTPITTIDFSPDSPPSQLFSLLITDNIKTQIIENTNQKLELIRQKYKQQELYEIEWVIWDSHEEEHKLQVVVTYLLILSRHYAPTNSTSVIVASWLVIKEV